MTTAEQGNTVKVHYTGTLDNGDMFDSSEGREPLTFTLGKGQVIPGFEKAVAGLTVGETVEVRIPPAEAYGEKVMDLMDKVPLSQMPDGLTPEVGMRLQSQTPDGQMMTVKVLEITDTHVTLDANHDLAGEALTFKIEVVEIV